MLITGIERCLLVMIEFFLNIVYNQLASTLVRRLEMLIYKYRHFRRRILRVQACTRNICAYSYNIP